MPVMDGVAQLEGEHGVGLQLLEALPELARGEAVLVEAVSPGDATQHLQLPTDQPGTGLQQLPHHWVTGVHRTELARAPLLRPVLVKLRRAEDGVYRPAVAERDRRAAL